MFLQLVTVPNNAQQTVNNASNLTQYHPLLISALAETMWRNRYPGAASMPFEAWPQAMTDRIFADFGGLAAFPGLAPGGATNWDHLIYAYLIECTRIHDIFRKVLETYQFSERLETPSLRGQRFWRNTEYLVYADPMPTMVWSLFSRTRPDEAADRMSIYWWALGLDLPHARELLQKQPYEKPSAANREFISTLELLLREVWRGIVNATNTSGERWTDDQAIAIAARRIYDMMNSRRLNGNLSREEFRAVAVMSWLHLAILWDSPAVVDLKAQAASPEERLGKIAERVGVKAHSQSKAFFDLAQPLSLLLQAIETGAFNDQANAQLLYNPAFAISRTSRVVIDNYTVATGRDLKASSVAVTGRAPPPSPPIPPQRMIRGNGAGVPVVTREA
ncbi:MAG TPA: hypothetical protein VJ779_04585 [Acetobacteraceae bacterium]|nr:hypothetical protein [Acetobacteraceae bacterium]